jgi:predicted nucleotidyltransferase
MKAIMAIINQIKKLDPMDAMKEVNKVVAKEGKYKNLSDTETKKIFDDTQDHIFEREYKPSEFEMNVDEAYGVTPDMKKELDIMKDLGATKTAERFELKQKYPGIDDRLLTQIIDDPDPQRKAEALATIDQAFELMRQGKSPDEILDIMKQMTDRTKQAKGGLSYLMGM